MATRVLLLVALSLCILPLIFPVATATFHVKGSVYCDTCRAGFETNATFYIEGTHTHTHTLLTCHLFFFLPNLLVYMLLILMENDHNCERGVKNRDTK